MSEWFAIKNVALQDPEFFSARRAARATVLDAAPTLADECDVLDALATVDADSVRPIFIKTTAIGSLMHRKIEPITAPLRAQIDGLRTLRDAGLKD